MRRQIAVHGTCIDCAAPACDPPARAGFNETGAMASSRGAVPLCAGARAIGTCLVPRGRMGEVYRARDTRLARDVAIKVLPQSALPEAGDERLDPEDTKWATTLLPSQHSMITCARRSITGSAARTCGHSTAMRISGRSAEMPSSRRSPPRQRSDCKSSKVAVRLNRTNG